MNNLFANLPEALTAEVFTELIRDRHLRIERIISQGQPSPAEGWYDQDENEWVLVLEGAGTLAFADGSEKHLEKGDFLNIPAHVRHRVVWTDPHRPTIWLAVFYT